MNKLNDTTILNSKSQIVLFGLNHFIKSIVNGDCCFICGASPEEKPFNNEHIIPNWLLRKHNLHSKRITLPNMTSINYGSYTTPCCTECNTLLGKEVEEPIRNLLSKPYNDIINDINSNKHLEHLLFLWLCLIYTKTHLKDTRLSLSRDTRKGDYKIGDLHHWQDIYHIHCMARAFYTKATIAKEVYGSVIIIPASDMEDFEKFDYADNSMAKTVLLQSGQFCIIASLTDANMGRSIMQSEISQINAPLHPFQIRELLASLTYYCLNIVEKPEFYSTYIPPGQYTIHAEVSSPFHLHPKGSDKIISSRGEILHFFIKDIFPSIDNKEKVLEEVRLGNRHFLFDSNGKFIDFRSFPYME